MAAIARWWEWNAHSSACSRVTPAMRAVFSPTVIAMFIAGVMSVSGWAAGNHGAWTPSGPGFIVAGAVDMDSTPPAMPHSTMPAAMLAAR